MRGSSQVRANAREADLMERGRRKASLNATLTEDARACTALHSPSHCHSLRLRNSLTCLSCGGGCTSLSLSLSLAHRLNSDSMFEHKNAEAGHAAGHDATANAIAVHVLKHFYRLLT